MSEAEGSKGKPSRGPAARTDRRGRGADGAVGITAAVLLLVSVGGYLYHRDQLASISEEHLRLRVVAPSSLGIGRPAEVHLLTTGLLGEPGAALVEMTLLAPDGKPILHQAHPTAADGRLTVTIPAQAELPPQGVRLEITAGRNGARETFETRLATEPARYRTCLATDRPLYRPGTTIFYRSLTLARFDLAAAPNQTIAFEFQDADGRPLPNSAHEGVIAQGVGHGAFTLPADVPAGEVTLVARSPRQQFPEVRLPVGIRTDDAAENAPESAAETITEVQVEFYPESGSLVPDLENRVYFAAYNPRGEPADLKGLIVDADGLPVAAVETIRSGMGAFNLRPRPDGRYRLRVGDPAGIETEPELPEVATQRNVVLSTGVGVFGPGKPLELNLRAAEGGIPLVVAAWCRGILVGHQPVVTRVLGDHAPREAAQGEGGVNQVAIEVPDEVSGLIELVVYDYRGSPPAPIAQRWVYRRPARRLELSAVAHVERSGPGSRATVTVNVTDESGNPAPAVLSLSAVDQARMGPADEDVVPLPACFLFSRDSRSVSRLANLALDASGDAEADVALDLALGTLRRAAKENDVHRTHGDLDAGSPPIVFDNLLPLRQKYEHILAQYRRDRTRALNMLTTLSFFGGFGLVLAVAMLGFLGVVSGLRLWIPAAGTAICCVLLGGLLLAPLSRGEAPESGAAYFYEPAIENEALPAGLPAPAVERPAPPFPAPLAYDSAAGDPAGWERGSGTLFWNPLLEVGPNGSVEVQFGLPDATTGICLRIEAHGAGRVASVRTCPENADPIY